MKKLFTTAILLAGLCLLGHAQQKKTFSTSNIFKQDYFIENSGQLEHLIDNGQNYDYGYFGVDAIFIAPTNFSVQLSELELKEEFKHLDKKELKEKRERESINKRNTNWVHHNWIGANANCVKSQEGETGHYFTYGAKKYDARGYSEVTYKNLYNKIDVRYEIHPKGGVEYAMIINPGGNWSDIEFSFEGAKNIVVTEDEIIIENKIRTLFESGIKAYYEDGEEVNFAFEKRPNGSIGFTANSDIDRNRTLIIDPWVTTNTSLSGTLGTTGAENKAYDVDHDQQGNLFVIGGGAAIGTNPNAYPKIAKYDVNGVLLWTFSGVVIAPAWSSSPASTSYARVGNLCVDKLSGKVYMSQGLNQASGSQMIRLDQLGNYDNFITNANTNFKEIWDMKFNCATSEIVGFGGGTSSNINFGLVDTLTAAVVTSNGTGMAGVGQDISCADIGPNGEVFVVFASGATSNDILRINPAYTGNLWNSPTGFFTLTEQGNKPFVNSSAFSNGHNGLASNASYVFFYDGLNLNCFNAVTGVPVGTGITFSTQTVKHQGGLYANSCDEVYVGGDDGNIFKFDFNGTNFIPIDTLLIPGQTGNSVYDIVFNPLNNLLYVSGDQFSATVDPLSPCINASTQFLLQIDSLCPDTAVVSIINPDPTASYSFSWYDSTTMTNVQTTFQPIGVYSDTLIGFTPGNTHSVTVIKQVACQLEYSQLSFTQICNDVTIYKCPDEYYVLNGDTLYLPGTYYDSILLNNVILIDRPEYNLTIVDSFCDGTAYVLPGGSSVAQAGTYIDAFQTQYGCDSIYTTTLTLLPSSRDSVYAEICDNESYTLPDNITVNTSGYYTSTLLMSNGCDSVIVTELNVLASYSDAQTASICATDSYTLPSGIIVRSSGIYIDSFLTIDGCDSTFTTDLTVVPVPSVNLGSIADLCIGTRIDLVANQNYASQYLWSTGSTDSIINVGLDGIYWVTVTSPPCEPASDTVEVKSKDCSCFIIVPNAFTPNKDNLNDCFRIVKRGDFDSYEFYIYNRWGESVFEADDPDACWDGRWRGEYAPVGTYYYFIKAKGTCGELIKKGDVTLLR